MKKYRKKFDNYPMIKYFDNRHSQHNTIHYFTYKAKSELNAWRTQNQRKSLEYETKRRSVNIRIIS